jgi:hypothetical protein
LLVCHALPYLTSAWLVQWQDKTLPCLLLQQLLLTCQHLRLPCLLLLLHLCGAVHDLRKSCTLHLCWGERLQDVLLLPH